MKELCYTVLRGHVRCACLLATRNAAPGRALQASNVALARHETHIKVKRDTIKEFSKTKSIRHTM